MNGTIFVFFALAFRNHFQLNTEYVHHNIYAFIYIFSSPMGQYFFVKHQVHTSQ